MPIPDPRLLFFSGFFDKLLTHMVHDSNQNPPEGKRGKSDFIRYLGVASTVGINMVATTFVGFAIGHWVVDRYLHSAPWGTIVFTLLGIVAGFRYLFKLARKAGEENNGNE